MNTEILLKYFPSLSERQLKQFVKMAEVYTEWNEKINVISRKDMDNFFERHVLHALSIAKICTFEKGSRVLDVGTGGGFPGIPLAVFFPEVDFILVDSIGKKITVVKAVVEALGLTNVKAQNTRAEAVVGSFDFVTARAVTRTAGLLPWVKNKIRKGSLSSLPNGLLLLKGGDLEEELAEISLPSMIVELPWIYKEDFFETKKCVYIPIDPQTEVKNRLSSLKVSFIEKQAVLPDIEELRRQNDDFQDSMGGDLNSLLGCGG